MKRKKTDPEIKSDAQPKHDFMRTGQENPELIKKFYKQIVNSFGYAYPAKM
jgi:hypothetical protein